MEENKSEKDSSPELEPTDIIAEDIDLEPMMKEGLESKDGRVERLPHTIMQPWQNETNLNATMLSENLGITQQLFERSQQIQQMFTHMSTMCLNRDSPTGGSMRILPEFV
ncbi:hypothetical protein E2C01_051614 [Portunus trituberculatus]|uniref:Uncharacterized protein n=1 Tax=Portunus trituberculatus TaxID=210409 RepID=A0A5B7GJD7_PORTR|nr:hypothetical protein [Portunus trituberculatus]